jgi:lipopolysaccharide transport system ATP-binding protein
MMNDARIALTDVSIRFRMAYQNNNSLPVVAKECFNKLRGRWQPEYFYALSNVSLAVRSGEIVGVLGRNGSGKSTLLRTICGIYTPDTGAVQVDGRVSALLQLGTGFNPVLSGRNNIWLGGLTLGLSRAQIEVQMPAIIAFAELESFIDIPMRYYSSGMMSRLSFAMVVAMEPDILLIDETLSVGDIGFQKKSRNAMQDLLQKASCQMIVSHDMDTIERICTRAILVEQGKILADDVPAKVIAEYHHLLNLAPEAATPAQSVHHMMSPSLSV